MLLDILRKGKILTNAGIQTPDGRTPNQTLHQPRYASYIQHCLRACRRAKLIIQQNIQTPAATRPVDLRKWAS